MNSEELELSLRSEFEAHIKSVLADVHQQVSDFQQKIDAELEKHRGQMNEALKEFSARVSDERPMDRAFRESVVEHLRLARDDGALVAASAIAEAETIGADSARSASFTLTRDAVNEISNQTSQSAILHTLVNYAEQFCPRGVFFIVRNEHFVGWQALGRDANTDEAAVRELNFEVGADTVLSDAVRSLTTIEHNGSTGVGNGRFLDPLGFGRPEKMYAIPLVARGRGVAALYVDGGKSAQPINIEALEMLVRVAGLTVELLASNQAARPQIADAEPAHVRSEPAIATVSEPTPAVHETETPEYATEPEYKFETATQWEPPATEPEAPEEVPVYEVETFNTAADETFEVQEIEVEAQAIEPEPEPEHETYTEVSTDFAFRSFDPEPEAPATEPEPEPEPVSYEEPTPVFSNGNGMSAPTFESIPEPEAPRTISGTRRLDLPIEVSEEERGTHTKARRFARLLVSEIKLYNEDKVREGRQSGDLYDRLREAIDRSREMYDKRVEPPVAQRFDYFHYELVNDLAEGDAARLGTSYPGAAI